MDIHLRKRKFPQQNINRVGMVRMKREAGQVNWMIGLFVVLFTGLLLVASVQLEHFYTIALYTEDALAASNLASALIDLEEYGVSHKIIIDKPSESYVCYQWALRENLNLNEAWCGPEGSIISGPVTVENYTVYNVDGETVWVSRFGSEGERSWKENVGNAKAPNGMHIENTSVYSEICFEIVVVPGISLQVRKGKLVDVVA